MTRVLASLVLLSFLGYAHQLSAAECNRVQWQEDVGAAWKEMKEEGRPLILFITLDDCAYCQKMKATTFCDEQVSNHVKRNFVPLRLDADAPWAQRFDISVYPTTLVIMPNARLAARLDGYATASELTRSLQVAEARTTRQAKLPE